MTTLSTITTADYNVFQFDNLTSSAAFQAAINAAITAGKSLYLVPTSPTNATMNVSGILINNATGFRLFAAPGSVTLKLPAYAPYILSVQNSNNVEVSGIEFDGSYLPSAPTPITTEWAAVYVTLSKRVKIEKCRIYNIFPIGIYYRNCGTSQSGATNPYGAAASFTNLPTIANSSGSISETEITNAYSKSAIESYGSPGLNITQNTIRNIKGNAIYINHQGDTPVGQSFFNGSIIDSNFISEVDTFSTGTSGQEGNAVAIWKANQVSVTNNTIRYCRFSAVRFNSCSQSICNGNSCYAMGETALYFEEPDGTTLTGKHPTAFVASNNIVNHCTTGVSVTNFTGTAGCRMAVVSNNIIRNIHKNVKSGGLGMLLEGDVAVTGNVIENADYYGIILGTGPATRDLLASNNVIRDCQYGVGVSSTTTSGAVFVNSNLIHIASASTNAVVSTIYDPSNVNTTIPNYRFNTNLAENQTTNAWVKVTNNYRSALTSPTSPSDGLEAAPAF